MTDLPLMNRRGLIARLVFISTLAGSICLVSWAGQDAKEPFEVGQRWAYRHEGPRPGSVEPNAIDGERILHVIDAIEEPEGKQWIIEERYTKDQKTKGRLYVNKERLVTAIEIVNEKGEAAKLKYNPPVPYQVIEMNIGQERTFETSLKVDSADFTLPSTSVIRRLDNETITTPAGEFADCRHFKITTKVIFNIKIAKIPVTEERERWYHPTVNGLVKEIYLKGPVKFLTWSRDGYTATSILTAFGKQEVPVEVRIAKQIPNVNQAQEQSNASQPGRISPLTIIAIFLGTIVVTAIGIYLIRKRVRQHAQTGSANQTLYDSHSLGDTP